MNSMRGFLILALPIILGGVLILAMVLGRPEPLVMKERPAPKQAQVRVQQPLHEQAAMPLPARVVPAQPAPAEEISRAVEDARIESTYRNYRTAVATGNRAVQDALQQVLARDREVALKVAQADLDRARTDADRDITKKTMEALRR